MSEELKKNEVYVVIATHEHGEDAYIFDREPSMVWQTVPYPTSSEQKHLVVDPKLEAKLEKITQEAYGYREDGTGNTEAFKVDVQRGYMSSIIEMDKFLEEDK
jgi:hypothetical protein